MKSKRLSFIIALVMLLSLIPAFTSTALAEEADYEVNIIAINEITAELGAIVPSDTTDVSINLTTETITLPSDFTVAAYSLDGGTKWKKGKLPSDAAKFSKLLDKGMTLWLADKYNEKAIKEDKTVVAEKGVPDTAKVIKFPEIGKRPKANIEKLAPFYSDNTPTKWMLCKKGSTEYTAPEGTYEWAETSNGKTATGDWKSIPADGYDIKAPGTKVTYLFRTAAIASSGAYTPASKIFKVKPVAFQKAPKYKAPTAKKGVATLKLKKGDFGKVGDKVYGSLTAATALKIVNEVSDDTSEILGGELVTIWKAATGKKPRSVEQVDLKMPVITASADTTGGDTATSYTVYFRENGGSGTMSNVTVDKGAAYTLPDCTFTPPSGKKFKGWAMNPAGAVIDSAAIRVNANTFLYAIWEDGVAYTVSFNANGGTGTMDNVKVNSGKVYELSGCTFTPPSGKAFKGWATSAAGTVITGTITVNANVTLYAIWGDASKAITSLSGFSYGWTEPPTPKQGDPVAGHFNFTCGTGYTARLSSDTFGRSKFGDDAVSVTVILETTGDYFFSAISYGAINDAFETYNGKSGINGFSDPENIQITPTQISVKVHWAPL